MKLTEEIIDAKNAELWAAAAKQHGSKFRVPRDEQTRMGELIRGMYVMQVWQSTPSAGNVVRFMKEYSIAEQVIEYLVTEYLGKERLKEAVQEKRPEKRADKWKSLEEWCKNNLFKEVTTEDVVALSGFSYPTVLNYLKTSPYFRKIKRGSWEVRDPKSDRERDKNG